MTKPLPRKRNPMAKDLQNPRYKQRVVKKRKGKGSYDRKKEGLENDNLGKGDC